MVTMIAHALGFTLASLLEIWGYDDARGPDHWADLDETFAIARTGRSQSPVDLGRSAHGSPSPFTLAYEPIDLTVRRFRYSLWADAAPGCILERGGHRQMLTSLHFHAPAEHLVEGRAAAAELHLVHEDDDGGTTVLGIFLEPGRPSQVLEPILRASTNADVTGDRLSAFDVAALLPDDLDSFWSYSGSRTTPPTIEGTEWVVLRHPVEASRGQISAIASLSPGNVRPVQALNGRTVLRTW
jgi:carbonic anhydrase